MRTNSSNFASIGALTRKTRHAEVLTDFNGDGVEHIGRPLKRRAGGGEALWIKLSQARKDSAWIKRDEIPGTTEPVGANPIMAIDAVKPGPVACACFATAPDCDFGVDAQRPKLRLADAGLPYLKPEAWPRRFSGAMSIASSCRSGSAIDPRGRRASAPGNPTHAKQGQVLRRRSADTAGGRATRAVDVSFAADHSRQAGEPP